MFDIIYKDKRFISVDMAAPNSNIYFSSDGCNFISQYTTPGVVINRVVSGDGTILATGNATLFESIKGGSWALNTDYSARFPSYIISGMCHAKNMFVLVGTAPGPIPFILITNDGITFTNNLSPAVGTGLNAVAYGNRLFVAVGNNGMTMYSHDGLSWSPGQLLGGAGYTLRRVIFGSRGFITAGDNGANGVIFYSEDGIQWSGNVCPGGLPILTSLTYAP